MASLSNPDRVRRLGELLEEQQEPFLLDLYLLERGHSKRSIHCGSKKRKAGITKCSKILRSVITKLVSGKAEKLQNRDSKSVEDGRFSVSSFVSDLRRKTHVAESDRFSSATCTTAFDTCSDISSSSSTDNFRALRLSNLKKVAADGKLQCACMDDSKQLSPVSILEFEGSPVHTHVEFYSRINKEENFSNLFSNLSMREETILSASSWEIIVSSLTEPHGIEVEELKELLGSSSSSQYIKNKRVLQQTKQLLFDCVREVLGSIAKEEQRCSVDEFLGSEQLAKIISEQICSWVKQASNLTNMTQLIESDLLQSRKEWSQFQPQINEIGIEIGDGILDEIRDEIVSDLIDCWQSKRN